MRDGHILAGERRRLWLYAVLACVAGLAIVLASAPAAHAAEDAPPSLMDNDDLLTNSQIGRFSIWRYEAGSGDVTAFETADMIWGVLTELVFWGTRAVAWIGLWAIEWAYSFDLVGVFADPAIKFADSLQREYVGPLGLNDFALFLAIAYSGYQLFRRRTALGLSELVISLLVAVFGAMLVANPAWLVRSALPFTIDLSAGLLDIATGLSTADDTTPGATSDADADDRSRQAVRPLTSALFHALVEQPYDLIGWGELLTGGCATKRDEILANNDMDPDSDDARNHMRGGVAGTVGGALDNLPGPAGDVAGDIASERLPGGDCAARADFNADPSMERVGMAVISFLVTLIVVTMLALVALTIVAAQLILAGHLVVVPFAVAVGVVPGTGRQLLLKFGGNVGQAYAVIIAMSFLLAMLLVGTSVILGSGNVPLLSRYIVLIVAVAVIFRLRKRLTNAVSYMTIRTAEKLRTRDVHGRAVGVASGTTAVMGLEPTYAAIRARYPRATLRSEVDRAARREVEALWD
jgi:hypothetical protein